MKILFKRVRVPIETPPNNDQWRLLRIVSPQAYKYVIVVLYLELLPCDFELNEIR